MRIHAATFFLVTLASGVIGQNRFEIRDAPLYDVTYAVEKCESDYCYGEFTVEIRRKGASAALQNFKLETDFALRDGKPKRGRVGYRDQSVVRFRDVNFDGHRDLTIQNGRDGGYSGASYNVYLYSLKQKKFVYTSGLSALATAPYMGMFTVDDMKRVIRTFQKSGCCMHQTEEYRFRGGRLQKVFDQYEDSMTTEGERIEVTTKRLVGGKWRTIVTHRPIK